jgi:septin family protein
VLLLLLLLLQVLIVGDSGLGKTTLVKTLLSTPGERLQVCRQQQRSQVRCGSRNSRTEKYAVAAAAQAFSVTWFALHSCSIVQDRPQMNARQQLMIAGSCSLTADAAYSMLH